LPERGKSRRKDNENPGASNSSFDEQLADRAATLAARLRSNPDALRSISNVNLAEVVAQDPKLSHILNASPELAQILKPENLQRTLDGLKDLPERLRTGQQLPNLLPRDADLTAQRKAGVGHLCPWRLNWKPNRVPIMLPHLPAGADATASLL
jgi:hypothetical protein